MSGTEGATATAAGTATDAAATTATTTAGTDTGTQAGTGAATQTQPTVEELTAAVEKWKALSRKNEQEKKANAEATAEQKKLLAEVAAKLGIQTADGATVDAAAITAQLEAAQRQNKSAATELAVLRAAGRLGVDGDALLDSRAFVAQLEGLDGTEAIEAAIKLAIAQHPGKYGRAGQSATGTTATGATGNGSTAGSATASASTAGEFASGPGGARQWTQADVERATPAELTKAMSQGLLTSYLAS